MKRNYAPLYSSAVHNRFVHSMGVFHLGEIVRKQLEKERLNSDILKEKIRPRKMEKLGKIFSLACLLHDVGHAPFSHTGEGFYLQPLKGETKNDKKKHAQYSDIHKLLIDEVNRKSFASDIKAITSFAAPHEIVSAYVGLKEYNKFFKDNKDREFFARCITGYLCS